MSTPTAASKERGRGGHRLSRAAPIRSTPSSWTTEAIRQQALLDAIRAGDAGFPDVTAAARVAGSPARIAKGLAAYRGNLDAVAVRALASAFPTVQAMVGAGDFSRLARAFTRVDPPRSGDLGEWGDGFPDWLRAQARLAEWPYIGDSAALDLAVHRCERAADVEFDPNSLGLLDRVDPKRLHLRLRPGTAVLASTWPVATIHAAHRDAGTDGFAAARAALLARRAEAVLVARSGWRAIVYPIDAPTLEWTRDLFAGRDLAGALDRAGTSFDFAGWLASALRHGWLKDVRCADD
jgi:hypothetical protein